MWESDFIRKINFKIYDVMNWLRKNCHTHIDHYIKKKSQSGSEVWSVIRA